MPQNPADLELERMFRAMAASCVPRAPLYAALSTIVADDPDLYRLLRHAPEQQQLPVLLLAATHKLVLDEPGCDLARWYPNLTPTPRPPDDPALAPTFARFVEAQHDALRTLLATRRTQTNEVGRCSMLLLAFGLLAAEVGELAHLDVGASGGLNLLLDRYAYRFTPGGSVGGPSPVVLESATRGDPPVPRAMPIVTARCGIDIAPIDVTNDGEAHWLEACVWPDQADRFQRLRAAIGIAREAPPELLAGDAVESVAPAVERLTRSGHPVVTNSWVLNYLTPAARLEYVAELDRVGSTRELSWVFVESPAFCPELPSPGGATDPELTQLTLVRWRAGARQIDHLATSHPHGFWIHWR